MKALGIDVSRWQPIIDWKKVVDSGVSFVFIKLSQADMVDPLFLSHWQRAREVGLLRGAYHYFSPASRWGSAATIFSNALLEDPGELPPVLDIEITGGLVNRELVRGIDAWLWLVRAQQRRAPMIYTGPGFWNSTVITGLKVPLYVDGFNTYDLWEAQYPYATDNPNAKIPYPPLPERAVIESFNKQIPLKGCLPWKFWQYTGRGKVDGIPGNVDMNIFNGTEDELKMFAIASLAGK